MKKNKKETKLKLRKFTVAKLNYFEMSMLQGGNVSENSGTTKTPPPTQSCVSCP